MQQDRDRPGESFLQALSSCLAPFLSHAGEKPSKHCKASPSHPHPAAQGQGRHPRGPQSPRQGWSSPDQEGFRPREAPPREAMLEVSSFTESGLKRKDVRSERLLASLSYSKRTH